ncbi:hypothetical protein PC123_g17022 [Phytophthora cactorum]|nr:hypothetical protein PC123_g17022 [Phytophthora cactorum]
MKKENAKHPKERVFRAQFPLELRVRTALLGLSASLSETSPGTRLCVYLFSYVISAFNLNVVMNVVTLRVSAVIAALVRFACTPFWASYALTISGTSSIRTFRGSHVSRWDEILSNEYEYEPDLGSSSGIHSPRFAQLSSESSRAHRAVVATGAERYLSYGQPQVDRDSRALHDRVAALEKLAYAASSSSASHQG